MRKKKIFVNKDSRSGFRTSLKFLLWAAIGLVVLVLFIPLTSRQKSGKEVAKKPTVEKGRVVKEIPRSLQPAAESLSRGQGEGTEVPREPASKPAATSDGKGPVPVTAAPQPSASKEKVAEIPSAPPKAQTAAEGVPKPAAARSATPDSAAGQAVKETQLPQSSSDAVAKETHTTAPKKPEPAMLPVSEGPPKSAATQPPVKPAKPSPAEPGSATGGPDSQKPAASGGRTLYTVQIATLKDKQSAEELRKSLQKKGFDAVIKATGDPKKGQSFILQLQPVESMSKASTLLEQVKYVPQSKPSIVPVQPGN